MTSYEDRFIKCISIASFEKKVVLKFYDICSKLLISDLFCYSPFPILLTNSTTMKSILSVATLMLAGFFCSGRLNNSLKSSISLNSSNASFYFAVSIEIRDSYSRDFRQAFKKVFEFCFLLAE